MNMGVGGLRTGIFNVADMAIMAGLGLIVISHFRPQNTPKEPVDMPLSQ